MKKLLLALVACLLWSLQGQAQETPSTVVYLKNGSVLYGTILGQSAEGQVKMRLRDGSVLIYSVADVLRTESQARPKYSPMVGFRGPQLAGYVDGGYTVAGDGLGRVELAGSAGALMTPFFYVGAGLGMSYCARADMGFDMATFLELRGRLPFEERKALFLSVRPGLGGLFVGDYSPGFYASALVGAELGGLTLGLGWSSQQLGREPEVGHFDTQGIETKYWTAGGLALRLGFLF